MKTELILVIPFILMCIYHFIYVIKHTQPKVIGTLKVNYEDPDSPPYLFLEIDSGKAYVIEKDKYVTLRVDLTQN